jgi:hypothetical protein
MSAGATGVFVAEKAAKLIAIDGIACKIKVRL